MKKWTVRVGDEEAETFEELCATNGVSIQGTLLSAICMFNEVYRERGSVPIEEWDDEPSIIPRGTLILRARQLDSDARRR